MKTKVCVFLLVLSLFSCTSNSHYKKLIVEYLETSAYKNFRTDFKIKFKEIQVDDFRVADSIAIFQKQYEEKLGERISIPQAEVNFNRSLMEEYQKEAEHDKIAELRFNSYSKDLKKSEERLEKRKAWKPDYLNKYADRDETEILAKRATCKISMLNPLLSVRQEFNAQFIISLDREKVLGIIVDEQPKR